MGRGLGYGEGLRVGNTDIGSLIKYFCTCWREGPMYRSWYGFLGAVCVVWKHADGKQTPRICIYPFCCVVTWWFTHGWYTHGWYTHGWYTFIADGMVSSSWSTQAV